MFKCKSVVFSLIVASLPPDIAIASDSTSLNRKNETCSTVRLDQPSPNGQAGPVQYSPVTDQATTLNCFAHATSHIVDAFLQSKERGKKIRISPEHLYATARKAPYTYMSANGRICDSIQNLRENGVCEYETATNILQELFSRPKGDFDLEIMRKALLETYVNHSLEPKVSPKLLSGFDTFICSSQAPSNKTLIGKTMPEIIRSLPDLAYTYLSHYLRQRCEATGHLIKFDGKSHPRIPACRRFDYQRSPKASTVQLHSPEEYKNETNRALNSQRPAGLEYCANLLHTSGGKSYIHNRQFPANILDNSEYDWGKNYDPDCGFHASVVIGRQKKEDGKCYYLIENSWGTGSFGFANDVIPEDGKFWVPETKLFDNTFKIETLEYK